jgi:BirA family biotin operon repressor/biotin-[acetyl-CoA-carboxylase] ligase
MTASAAPFRLDRLAEVDSTNAEAMRRAVAGERGPLWIIADRQTAGRGRAGRSWASEPGNLQASLLTAVETPVSSASQLALVAGIAVFDAIATAVGAAPPGLRLKWPNDVLIDGRKAGGILIESTTTPAGLIAVVGIGINIASAPDLPDRPATRLADHGFAGDPLALLARIADATTVWLAIWDRGTGFEVIREAWLNRAHPIGERMSINTGSERIAGAFLGLDAEGALLLDGPGGARRFTFGDVSLAR